MKRQMHRMSTYFGRRGGILILFGFVWTIIGFGFATSNTERFSRPGPGGPLEFMDSTPWPGLLWVVCGLIALVNGFMRRRWDNQDALGFGVLVVPAIMWACFYLTSWVQWLITHYYMEYPYGRAESYIGALVYTVIIVITRIVANWPDPSDLQYAPRDEAIE